uniref:BTB domain-containing protein n=1 Tax=Panagrolaimus davidi TaxID=227884 RepID=A0A914P696_9BILA
MSLQSSEDTLKLYTIKKEFFIEKHVFTDRGSYVSKLQTFDGIQNVSFQIEMRKKRSAENHGDYYWGIYVIVNAPVSLECYVNFNLDSSERNKVHDCCDGIIDQGSDKIGIDEYIQHDHFMMKRSGFFLNKKAKITVKLTFSYTSKADEELYEPIKMIQSNEWCKRLQNHGKKDFKFIVGNVSIEIHKFFVTLESPVIAAMLENENFIEAQTGEMVITDFGAGIVKAVVEFCYGEDISYIMDLPDFAVDILLFADKYDMKNLKSAFEEYYCKKLTRYNVGKILEAADKVNAVILKNKCIAFIHKFPRKQRKDIAYGCKSLDYELRQLFM